MTRKPIPSSQQEEEIELITKQFREYVRPSALYLFGSAAHGGMTDQSDFDLLVVMAYRKSIRTAQKKFSEIRKYLPKRSYDVVWMTEEAFAKKSSIGGVSLIAREDGRRLI